MKTKNFQFSIFNFQKGFTFIEIIISVSVFIILALGAYQGYIGVSSAVAAARYKALAADLINAQFEIIKNLPYTNVGITGGNPNGVVASLQTIVRDGVSFAVTTTITYVDDTFDGILGAGDAFPHDYKLVEISVACASCKSFTPVVITGRVSPKNLES